MWEIETGELMFTLELTFSHVHSVVFDPTGEKIAVGSSDNNAYIMNSWTDELLYTLEGHEVGPDLLQYSCFKCTNYNIYVFILLRIKLPLHGTYIYVLL